MNRLFRLAALVVGLVSGLMLGSCRGQSDEVPEGTLRIFADKTSIAADGTDLVTFTVMFGSQDVSTERTMQLVRNGKLCNYGVNTFSTAVPGEYVFSAEYYHDGRYYSDNTVKVIATSSEEDGEKKGYVQQTLGFQFTSIGCTACPHLATSIKQVQADFPNRLVPVAFHQDFNYPDEMTHTMTASYYALIKKQGLPQFNANLIINNDYITVSEYDQIVSILDRVEENYPATCGVAIDSSLDESSREVIITTKITSNTPSVYRFQIFLVEDGFVSFQYGSNEAGNYVHNNVVREVMSQSVYGAEFNEGMNMQVGVEASAERTMTISRGYDMSKMRIVVAALVSYDGGNSYVVSNCATCPVGASVDYLVK